MNLYLCICVCVSVFDRSPEVLVHDGVVVALDGHLLEVVVAVVAAEHRGRPLRVDRRLHEVGAWVFEVLRSCAQAGGISADLFIKEMPHVSIVKVLESCTQTKDFFLSCVSGY